MIKKVFRKLFYDDAYGIALRKLSDKEEMYYTRYPNWDYWYADPFICNDVSGEYVFVEAMDYYKGIGRISAAPIKDNSVGKFKVVLAENFHMSFPNIFNYNGTWYMIPETSESKQLRLYKCIDFPYKWILEKILVDGRILVDSIIWFVGEDEVIINSYDIENQDKPFDYAIRYSFTDATVKEVILLDVQTHGRAGGNIFKKDNKLFRMIQNCELCYGDYLEEYYITKCTSESLEEMKERIIRSSDITFDYNRGISHIHTYNIDDAYEVVDFRYRKFYLLKIISKLVSKVYRKIRLVMKE